MPRRRHFIARPVEHLSAAAAVHARLTQGELSRDAGDDQADAEAPTTKGQSKRAQARETGTGRFK